MADVFLGVNTAKADALKTRYWRSVIRVKNIYNILEMTVNQALEFFFCGEWS